MPSSRDILLAALTRSSTEVVCIAWARREKTGGGVFSSTKLCDRGVVEQGGCWSARTQDGVFGTPLMTEVIVNFCSGFPQKDSISRGGGHCQYSSTHTIATYFYYVIEWRRFFPVLLNDHFVVSPVLSITRFFVVPTLSSLSFHVVSSRSSTQQASQQCKAYDTKSLELVLSLSSSLIQASLLLRILLLIAVPSNCSLFWL